LNLKKDKETRKQHNKELDEKCAEVQMLKFGQVINLETLEQMSVNKTAEELKERLKLEQQVRILNYETEREKEGERETESGRGRKRGRGELLTYYF